MTKLKVSYHKLFSKGIFMINFDRNDNLAKLWTKVQSFESKPAVDYSMHEIVAELKENMNAAKDDQERLSTVLLAGRIRDISEQEQQKNQGVWGHIRAFFSSLHNYITLRTFKSSEQLGIDLADELLIKTRTDKMEKEIADKIKPEVAKTDLSSFVGQGEMKESQENYLEFILDHFKDIHGLRRWEEDGSSTPQERIFNIKIFKEYGSVHTRFMTEIEKDIQIKITRNDHEIVISFPKGFIIKRLKNDESIRELRLNDQKDEVIFQSDKNDILKLSYWDAMWIYN